MTRRTAPRPTKAQLLERYKRPDGRERIRELQRRMEDAVSGNTNAIARFQEKLEEAQRDIEWLRQNAETARSVLRDIAEITGEIAA